MLKRCGGFRCVKIIKIRNLSSSANPLVRYCHFGISPVNYSDSDSDHIVSLRNDKVCHGFLSSFTVSTTKNDAALIKVLTHLKTLYRFLSVVTD